MCGFGTRRDLTSAAKLQPSNRDVRLKLAACKEGATAQKAKERALYSAMLASGGASAKEPAEAEASKADAMKEAVKVEAANAEAKAEVAATKATKEAQALSGSVAADFPDGIQMF